MKLAKLLVGVTVCAGAAGSAFAHGHVRGHVVIGVGPWWGPGWWYEPPPAYYYPPRIEVVEPPVYIEKDSDAAAPADSAEDYWYYCPESRKYYPYAKKCPRGWKRVAPTPPDAPDSR